MSSEIDFDLDSYFERIGYSGARTATLETLKALHQLHPESHFVTGLIAARPVPGKRYALLNNKLKIHHLDGETEKETLTSAGELAEVLEHTFQLTLPKHTSLNAKLEKLCTGKDTVL